MTPAPQPSLPFSSVRLLLTEDFTPLLEWMVETIELELGCMVAPARDGASTQRLLRDWRPDILVLDLGLPDLDGRDFLRQATADPDGPAVVVWTSRIGPAGVPDLLRAGARTVLLKPTTIDEIVEAIRPLAEQTVRQLRRDQGDAPPPA